MPPSTDRILAQCATFNAKLTPEEGLLVKNAVPTLVAESRLSGLCTDKQIDDALGHVITTDIPNMQELSINRQRSLWLNKAGVLALRQESERKAREKAERAAKSRAFKTRIDQRLGEITADINSGAIAVKSGPDAPCYCANICGFVKRKRVEDGEDDRWRGCSNCAEWYCPAANCQKRLKKHMPVCLLRTELNNFDM